MQKLHVFLILDNVCGADSNNDIAHSSSACLHSLQLSVYLCTLCDRWFTEEHAVTMHMKKHAVTWHYECYCCRKLFTTESQMCVNMNVHLKKQKSEQCGNCFLTIDALTRPRRIHTGKKPFQCVICGLRLTTHYHLARHMSIHSGVKPYACSVCDRRFARNDHLTKHMNMHTGQGRYECHVCGKQFTQLYYLNRHSNIHREVKRYVCHVCDQEFTRASHLHRHTKVHDGEEPCLLCYRFHSVHDSHSVEHVTVADESILPAFSNTA